MTRFRHRNVLVTGAASGIGAAFARLAAGEGAAFLALVDRDASGLASVAEAIGDSGARVRTFDHDVADEAAWAGAAQAITEEVGGVDAAALCAGVADGGPIAELSLAAWRRVMATNLDGAFLSLQAALRLAAGRAGAAIVLVGSASGAKPAPGTSAYGAAKAGVAQLGKVAALEAAPGVRVNVLAPAGVKTPMFSQAPFFASMAAELGGEAAAWAALAEDMPLGRFAEPEEAAAQMAFLLSAEAGSITGAVLLADGGYAL